MDRIGVHGDIRELPFPLPLFLTQVIPRIRVAYVCDSDARQDTERECGADTSKNRRHQRDNQPSSEDAMLFGK
ncbi:MAG: hypothetical protein ACK553_14165 [Planctomycetota bacterium]